MRKVSWNALFVVDDVKDYEQSIKVSTIQSMVGISMYPWWLLLFHFIMHHVVTSDCYFPASEPVWIVHSALWYLQQIWVQGEYFMYSPDFLKDVLHKMSSCRLVPLFHNILPVCSYAGSSASLLELGENTSMGWITQRLVTTVVLQRNSIALFSASVQQTLHFCSMHQKIHIAECCTTLVLVSVLMNLL